MVHRRKISTTEVRSNKRFFILKVMSDFGKMITAPHGCSTFRAKNFKEQLKLKLKQCLKLAQNWFGTQTSRARNTLL